MNTSNKSFPKHAEFVYGVHPDAVKEHFGTGTLCRVDMNKTEMDDVLNMMEANVMGARRAIIAKTDLLRQVIGYGLPFQRSGNPHDDRLRFAMYRRNKKNGEGQLAFKYSLGIGGHTEHEDSVCYVYHQDKNSMLANSSVIDFRRMLDVAFLREKEQEARFGIPEGADPHLKIGKVGVVFDSEPKVGYVGNHHIGVIYVIETPPNTSFEVIEEMNDTMGWFTIDELREFHRDDYEPWSAMIIDILEILQERILHSKVEYDINGVSDDRPVVSSEALEPFGDWVKGHLERMDNLPASESFLPDVEVVVKDKEQE